MTDTWYDIAQIGLEHMILWGEREGVHFERDLTDDERDLVTALGDKHDVAMQKLLASLAAKAPAEAGDAG